MPLLNRCGSIAALAVALAFSWQWLTVQFVYKGNWTGLFYTGALVPVPEQLRASTYTFPASTGYDGQMYRYVAYDPLMSGQESRFVDDLRLRYRRILVPTLARLIALGQPKFIDAAFKGVVLLFTGLGTFWLSRYLQSHNFHPAAGFLFLLLPSTISAVDRMLVDGALVAICAGWLLYLRENRVIPLFALCAAAPLVRETGVLVPAAAVLHFAAVRQFRRSALFCAAFVPATAWTLFVHLSTPPMVHRELLSVPVLGIVQRLFVLRDAADPLIQAALRITDVLAVVSLLLTLPASIYLTRRLTAPGLRAYAALYAALVAVMGGSYYMLDPYAFARATSPLLLLLLVQALVLRRWWLAVPPLGLTAAISVYTVTNAGRILQGMLAAQ